MQMSTLEKEMATHSSTLAWSSPGPPHLALETQAEQMQVTQHCKVMLSGCRGRRGMFNEPNVLFYVFVC